ncbi:MAG: HAMP domain-containing protein [Phycisphaerales bacterium]|nr:MAG: HAMP domain-containing protein [Phycisphaerales bacterium]
MRLRSWLQVSLAQKVSVLFGTAVLLTITVTLLFPWLQMTALDEEAMLMEANWLASAAYQAVDLESPDWADAQLKLERRWPVLSAELGLPEVKPQLVLVGPAAGPGFRADAIERLRENPQQRYFWRIQDDRRIFRFALAVRGAQADAHPHVLRGIIDIRLPIPQTAAAWNSIVTVLAGASGAVLAVFVFYLVTQRLVLSPVRSLRQVAQKVTTGDIDVRASITSGDEFQQLSEAFNDMLTHLKIAQDELQKTNRSLDIKLGELSETNVALYESNRVKSEFLANVTHELRTPLVSIIGFAELLRDSWKNPNADRERLARYSENILISGRSLLDIINDLLDLAKIEAGRMDLHVSDFSITELCRDLIDFVRPLADKKDQELTLTLPDNAPRFKSDSGKVRQILYNLLSNAIKFTPPGGAVSLAVECAGESAACLIVRDTGPGISKEDQETVFDKFRQLDSSKTREYEGTGLGLAITKELVSVLGGSIELASVAGKGTTFIVKLPVTSKNRVSRSKIRVT